MFVLLSCSIWVLLATGAVVAGRGKSDKATELLDKVVAAIGDVSALNRLEIQSTGSTWMPLEGESPEELVFSSTYQQNYTFDLDNDNLRMDMTWTSFFENFQFSPPVTFSRVFNGDVGGGDGQLGFISPGTYPSSSVSAFKRQQLLFNPHFLLKEALKNPDMVSSGKDRRGRRQILGIDDEVSKIRLFLDRKGSGRIDGLSLKESNPLLRDTKITVRYVDWSLESQGIAFPRTIKVIGRGSKFWEETRDAVEVEPDLSASHFDLLEGTDADSFDADSYEFGTQAQHHCAGFFHLGFHSGFDQTYPPGEELAPGLTLLSSGASSLVIEHSDGVILLEAAGSEVTAKNLLAAVEALAPDSTITHLIQSHHHVDHASGCREVVAESGATLVVGYGVGEFWEDVLAAPSKVRPDTIYVTGIEGKVMEVEELGEITLIDTGDLVVTAHHSNKDPHVDDAVITTIETDGQLFIFQADFYNAGFGASVVKGGPEAFFVALRELGILDADCKADHPLTIVPAHGLAQSLEVSLTELAGIGIDVGC